VTATDRLSAAPTLSETPFDDGGFVAVWAVAATTYGAGDTLTTLAVVWYSAVVTEANPVVAAVTSTAGVPGLVALKLAAFLCCLALALDAARRADRLGFYLPPATLAVLGALATTLNVLLLSG
jgi:Flp pilus assembly protein TadB